MTAGEAHGPCDIAGPAGDLLLLDQHPAIPAELVVELLDELDRLVAIGANNGMDDLAEETQEHVRRPGHQIEPLVAIDPGVGPILRIVDAVLPDVAGRVVEAG